MLKKPTRLTCYEVGASVKPKNSSLSRLWGEGGQRPGEGINDQRRSNVRGIRSLATRLFEGNQFCLFTYRC